MASIARSIPAAVQQLMSSGEITIPELPTDVSKSFNVIHLPAQFVASSTSDVLEGVFAARLQSPIDSKDWLWCESMCVINKSDITAFANNDLGLLTQRVTDAVRRLYDDVIYKYSQTAILGETNACG